MFTLRIIEETRQDKKEPFGQVIENHELGCSYSILKKGNTKEFNETMGRLYPETNHDNIKALLCADNGQEFFIESETENRRLDYFIMNENGKTFERL